MRWVLRVVLPVSLALTAVLIGLFLATDDPRFATGRVFSSPHQHLTWLGFAEYVTVMCGASLTLVGNVADFCRYTRTRRDMRIGLVASALSAAAVTTFVGGYAAAATGETNPFVAVADLTSSTLLLVAIALAIVVQGLAANITNVYTSGLSIVNTAPPLGRIRATVLAGAAAVTLSAFPDFVHHAQNWVTHLGNVAALFDPDGRYRYLNGVNVEAVLAVAVGVAVYYAVPAEWVKVLWGIGAAAAAYLGLVAAVRQAAPAPATLEQ